MALYYCLDSRGEPVVVRDLSLWGCWMHTNDRCVRVDRVGSVEVSTVFLGLDHAAGGRVPVLWETLVFGGVLDGEQRRYTSRAQALIGHDQMLVQVTSAETGNHPVRRPPRGRRVKMLSVDARAIRLRS